MAERDEKVKMIEEGRSFYRNRDYVQAEAVLCRLVEGGCVFADAYNMLGVIAHGMNRFREAAGYFEEALKVNPRYIEAAMNLAIVAGDMGESRTAKEAYEKLEQIGSAGSDVPSLTMAKVANMYAEIGDVFAREGRFDRACEDYRRSLDLCPLFVDIRKRLAVVLSELRRYGEAEQELLRALQDRPLYVPAKVQLGLVYYSAGKVMAALDTWYAVLREFPENSLAKMYTQMVLGEKTERKEEEEAGQ